MNNLQISSEDVSQYSNQLMMLEEQVFNIFNDIKAKMNQIETVWSSPASKNMMVQFQRLNPVFDQYVQALKEYALYLNQTALTYAENEQILTTTLNNG